MKEFLPLREDAEKSGKLLKAASDKHASAEEACKLIKNFGAGRNQDDQLCRGHSTKCGIPPQVADQLKNGHKNTESMQQKVCDVAAAGAGRGPAGPSLSDVLGSSAALPEADHDQEGRQHLRYAERQRADAMIDAGVSTVAI